MWIYFTLPVIAGLIGWFTNYLAVKMLFFPREPVKILGMTIQGIFPKRQKTIADKLGKMVAAELLHFEDIKDRIKHPENVEMISQNIEVKLDEYLDETLPEKYPWMSFFVRKNTKIKIKQEVLDEISHMAPNVMDEFLTKIETSLDVETIVREKVTLLSPVRLERLILDVLKKEFKFIEYVGAGIGFLVGLLQLGMMFLI